MYTYVHRSKSFYVSIHTYVHNLMCVYKGTTQSTVPDLHYCGS